jgi:hypothetical protein
MKNKKISSVASFTIIGLLVVAVVGYYYFENNQIAAMNSSSGDLQAFVLWGITIPPVHPMAMGTTTASSTPNAIGVMCRSAYSTCMDNAANAYANCTSGDCQGNLDAAVNKCAAALNTCVNNAGKSPRQSTTQS